jgi:hypothetical protein
MTVIRILQLVTLIARLGHIPPVPFSTMDEHRGGGLRV